MTAPINIIKNENNTNTNFPDVIELTRYDNVTNNDVNNTTKDNKGETNHEVTVTTNRQQNNNPQYHHHVSLVIHLTGEFGNHLNKFVRGWGLAKLMEDEYNITSHILIKQQHFHKAIPSKIFTQKCIDRFRREDFSSYIHLVVEEKEQNGNKDYFLRKKTLTLTVITWT